MAIILDVTPPGTGQTFASSLWPKTHFDTGDYTVTITPSSGSGGNYNGFRAILCGPAVSGFTGGLWMVDNQIHVYRASDDALRGNSSTLTFSASQPITVQVRQSANSVTVSGATTGNGTFSLGSPGNTFTVGTLTVGGMTGDISYPWLGSISDVEDLGHAPLAADPGSFALTGAVAGLLRGRRLVAESGLFAITGAAIGLEPEGVHLGDHETDFQIFGNANRDASVEISVEQGSTVVVFAGGDVADLANGVDDSQGNVYQDLGQHTYTDWATFATRAMHAVVDADPALEVTVPVTLFSENTTFAIEVCGGAQVTSAWAQEGNTGADTTQASPTISTSGPAVIGLTHPTAGPRGVLYQVRPAAVHVDNELIELQNLHRVQ